MTDKSLIGIGIAAVATPVLAFLIFGGLGGRPESKTSAPAGIATAPAPANSQAAPGTPSYARPLTPTDLEHLAQTVKLSEDENEKRGTKKEFWARALPVAQRMLDEGSADCEQRNWLTQFIATGQLALGDSSEYYARARFLATLYRNDHELGTGIPSN